MIDATPQSPPLETDDPGVPDKGEYEINLLTAADLSNAAHRVDLFEVDANYGILLKLMGHEVPAQLKFESPLASTSGNGQPFTLGAGAALVGIKLNLYNNESTGVRMSIYPQLEFATSGSVEKELADPGQTLHIPFLVAKELNFMTIVANGGIQKPLHDPGRETTGVFALGFGRAFWRNLAVMCELRGESTFNLEHDRLVSTSVGVIHGERGLIWYARMAGTYLSPWASNC